MRLPFILVVVPFKGEIEYVLNFIRSIAPSYVSGFSWSLILWDDGSTDQELEYLYNSIPKDMMIIKHNNVGYTRTVHDIINMAKEQQEHDYLLLVNSDVKFERGTMYNLLKRSLSNPNAAAIGGKVLKYDEDVIIHTGTRLENEEVVDPYCGLHKDDPKTNFVERRLWVNGCCTLYNLNILRKENLNFDVDFFSPAYFEEADLMSKLNYMGYSVMYEPRALIRHKVNVTHNKQRDENEKVFWRNWNMYLTKWKPYFPSKQMQF